MTIRTYSELVLRTTLEARFEYLKLGGFVGEDTFGYSRYLNQAFYASTGWKRARDLVIIRDSGRDLGLEGFEIHGRLMVHHMNPIQPKDLVHFNTDVLDPEYLICVSETTHNAIHYGDKSLLPTGMIERRPGDTRLW